MNAKTERYGRKWSFAVFGGSGLRPQAGLLPRRCHAYGNYRTTDRMAVVPLVGGLFSITKRVASPLS